LLGTPISQRGAEAYGHLAPAAEALWGACRRSLRPANRPEKRLRGAATLAARFAAKGPVLYFTELLDGPGRVENGRTKQGKRSVSDFNPVSSSLSALTVPGLIGRARAIELLANAVLPLLAAAGPAESARRAEAVFRRLSLPVRYGAVRHLHEAVGVENQKQTSENGTHDYGLSNFDVRAGGGSDRGVHVNFRRQQGMLYLLKQYCTQGGCGRCPLS
jgi:hypothetical protein